MNRWGWHAFNALLLGWSLADWIRTGSPGMLAAFMAAWGIGYGLGRMEAAGDDRRESLRLPPQAQKAPSPPRVTLEKRPGDAP